MSGLVHILECTEMERGWGQTPDGFLIFLSDEDLQVFLHIEYSSRGEDVPAWYIKYDKLEPRLALECWRDSIQARIDAGKDAHISIEHLKQLNSPIL